MIYGTTGFRLLRGSSYIDQDFNRMRAEIEFEKAEKVSHVSVVNGYRSNTIKGYYTTVKIEFEKLTKAEAKLLRSLRNENITFYLHYDSALAFDQAFVYGIMESADFYYLDNIYFKDACTVIIKSKDFVSDNLDITYDNLVDENGDGVIDENSNTIITQ